MSKQRTYWHLAHLDRKPTDYDIVTSHLLYSNGRGFEVNGPFAQWRERYVARSEFSVDDWERFRDPRETTYTKYTQLQDTKETFVDELFKSADETRYDQRLDPAWLAVLARTIGPIRYPLHALQMASAYVGQCAPSGRLVITSLFQSADEMRRIQRFAYRLGQLQQTHPSFASDSRSTWERDELWQPLRRAIERLLVTYDWGEAFVALNLCLKPAFDVLFVTRFAELARSANDDLLARLLFSFDEDCSWHREWTAALVRMTIEQRHENLHALRQWTVAWDSVAKAALHGFAPLFGDVSEKVEAQLREHRIACRLLERSS